jgi:uncharacterized protein with HEPN domain
LSETLSTYDVALAGEILRQIRRAALTVLRRFKPIESRNGFTASEDGLEKLDAICMQLIAIGESVKNLDEVTEGSLPRPYPDIEWKRVLGMREIMSHHCFDVDAEIVFSVCSNHNDKLARTAEGMADDLR